MEQESSWHFLEKSISSDDQSTGTHSSFLVGLGQPGAQQNTVNSRTFYPGAHGEKSDVVFCTSDSVLFYVDMGFVSTVSATAFQKVLQSAAVIPNDGQTTALYLVTTPEASQVLDIILHFLHSLTFANGTPPFHYFVDSILSMSKYEIDAATLLVPSNPCYDHILSFAPAYPLDIYALAAHLDIYHLAVASSSHLLSLPLVNITDEMAARMGATYLRRLYTLHQHRLDMLKLIVAQPPHPHPPTKTCDFLRQKQLTRAWVMTGGYFIWEGKCDLSAKVIQSSFDSLKAHIDCKECQEMLAGRVKDVIARWVVVRRTI